MKREYKGIGIGTRCGFGSYRKVYTVQHKDFYHDYDGVGGYNYHEPFCYSRLKDAWRLELPTHTPSTHQSNKNFIYFRLKACILISFCYNRLSNRKPYRLGSD